MIEERVEEAVAAVREKIDARPRVGIVAGSGLAPLAGTVKNATILETESLPGYPVSTVAGHAGHLLFGEVGGVSAAVLSGRVHRYEGYSLGEVTIPVRLLARLGIEVLILTNAAGGIIRNDLAPGDIMLISDHLNLQGSSPLEGPNVDSWGPRFPDMSEVYDRELGLVAREVARSMNLALTDGVYASLPGPQYETPAEVRMLRGLGADTVGMSTVPEAIVARHMGVRVLGFSLVSNAAAGLSETPLSHEEVMEAGQAAGATMTELVTRIIQRFGETS